MSFGIPAPELTVTPIVEALTASNGDLMLVASALTTHLGKQLTDTEALVGSVVSTARRSLAGRVAASTTDLTGVISTLGADLSSAASTTDSLLADLDAQLRATLGDSYPASSPDPKPITLPTIDPVPDTSPQSPPPPLPPSPWTVERDTLAQDTDTVEILTAKLSETPVQRDKPTEVVSQERAVDEWLATVPGWAGVPAALDDGFPTPGTPEFCAQADQIVEFFTMVGDRVTSIVNGVADANRLVQIFKDSRPSGSVLSFSQSLLDQFYLLMIDIIEVSKPVWEWVFGIVKAVYHWQKTLMKRYNGDAVMGLTVVESVLASLGKFRLGTDAGAWITGDVQLRFGVFERIVGLMRNYMVPIALPEIGEVTHAWFRGDIDIDIRNCLWKLHGLDPDVYETYAIAHSERVLGREAIKLVRRRGGSENEQLAALRRSGYVDAEQAAAALELYDEIPSVSDHLHWLRRNVFDDDYVRDYELLDGFEERFWAKFGGDLQAQGMKKEYAALHYAAHWIQPSPTQMREFVYRLRPETVGEERSFTLDDFKRLLAEQDYSPLAREWFADTAHHILTRTQLEQLHLLRVIDDDALSSGLQDTGYDAATAGRLVAASKIRNVRARAASAHGWTTAVIAKALATGWLELPAARLLFRDLGYDAATADLARDRALMELQAQIVTRARSRLLSTTVAQVKQALDVGVMTQSQAAQALMAVGWPQAQANGIAQLEAAGAGVKRTRQAITRLRSSYLRGEIDARFARGALQGLGVVAEAIESYLSVWALALTPRRKQRSAKEAVESLAQGDITTGDAISRLLNLGYSDADTRLYMADAQRRLAHLDTARRAAEERKGRAGIAALEKTAREAKRQEALTLKALERQAPLAKLQRWLQLGIIGRDIFTRRLALYGYSAESIADHAAEACAAKGAACVDTVTKPGSDGTVPHS